MYRISVCFKTIYTVPQTPTVEHSDIKQDPPSMGILSSESEIVTETVRF